MQTTQDWLNMVIHGISEIQLILREFSAKMTKNYKNPHSHTTHTYQLITAHPPRLP